MRKSPANETDKAGSVQGKQGIAIVGNMNVGKTSLFSRICGQEKASINIPGSTISITTGRIKGTGSIRTSGRTCNP